MIQILNFITTNDMNWRIVMLKKYLKKILIVLFLIVISNNAYALKIAEIIGGNYPYAKIISYNGNHEFWVIADRFSEVIGVKKPRLLAIEALKLLDECISEDKTLNDCRPVIRKERDKRRGGDNSEKAFRNNPILAYKSSVFFAGLLSFQIYGTDKWQFDKSWKDDAEEILGIYVNSMKKVILDELGKKLNSNNIEISSLKEDKKNIDKKIKLYNDFFVTIPNYYKKEIGDIGNNSVYEKKLRSLLAINKKIKKANSDLEKMR